MVENATASTIARKIKLIKSSARILFFLFEEDTKLLPGGYRGG